MDYQKMIQRTNQENSFMKYNHIRLAEMEQDHAVVILDVQPESYNLFGNIHGGVHVTMADCAAGAAARSRGIRHVTIGHSFEFMSTSSNQTLCASAAVRHRGKNICIVAVDVKDGDGKLLSGGTFTMYSTGMLEED